MTQLVFTIEGMDCAEEVAVLKRVVGPLVAGEQHLNFDVLQGTMTVTLPAACPPAETIQQAVARTGMRARLQHAPTLAAPEEQPTLWQRYGRVVLCVVSGLCLLSGWLWHVLHAGSLTAVFLVEPHQHLVAPPFPSLSLYTLAVVSGAWFVIPKAWYALRTRRPDMHLLMLVAVVGAIGIGEWLEAATVAWLFALALLLEAWSLGRARRAMRALFEVTPTVAHCLSDTDDHVHEQPLETVAVGTRVLVRPGETIPLDGVILRGITTVNQAPITGESRLVSKTPGDEVYAGTINGDGAITLRTSKPATDTTLARMVRLVAETQARRSPREQWVERFARVYTPVMLLLALLLAVVPPLWTGGGWERWLYEALVLLVIACPCALVISTPVSIVAGLTAAARAGVLIKGGASLEAPAHVRAIAFDKTGTLTYGRPIVQEVIPLHGHTSQELLTCAAALEVHSAHPLARAIVHKAHSLGLTAPPAEHYTTLQGRGAEASIQGKRFWIGSQRLMADLGVADPAFHRLATRLEDAGHSLVAISTEEHICGVISAADGIRTAAVEVVQALKRLGITAVVMLTGDNQSTAQAVAAAIGVDQVRAELLPEDKVRAVEDLRDTYGDIAMVGDGMNDAPALAAATVGIAMGTMGTAVAMETADITLMSDDLQTLTWLVRHARRTVRVTKQNILCALGLKLLFLALAVAGVATLWMAMVADMGASLLVIFNGLRLLQPPHTMPLWHRD